MTCTPQPQVCVCLLVPRRQLSSFVRLCAVHFLGGLAHRLRPPPRQPRCAIDICVVRREVSSLHTSLWSRRLLQSAASPSCFALWGVAPGRVTILLVYNEFPWSAMRDAALCVESMNCALCRVGSKSRGYELPVPSRKADAAAANNPGPASAAAACAGELARGISAPVTARPPASGGLGGWGKPGL